MKLIINALLAFIGRGAYALLALPFFLLGILLSKNKTKYLLNIAISYDQLSNTLGAPLLNKILIKKRGYKFGNPDQTLSYVLGLNKKSEHLSKLGKFFTNMLNKIEPNHVEKAIKAHEKNGTTN
jgi:hypothetical protein